MRNKFYNFYYPPAKPLNYENFWRTKIIQDFSLPNPLINYIILNPTKYPNSYQKLLESCKYFYAKKTHLLVKEMAHINSTKWFFQHFRTSKAKVYPNPNFGTNGFDILQLPGKLWILKNLIIYSEHSISGAALLAPKIYRCDVKILELRKQKLSLNQFKIFCQNVEKCILCASFVTDEKGHIEIPFETVLESMPNLIKLNIAFGKGTTCITSETTKNFIKIPHLQKIKEFTLWYTPENFNIEDYVDYLNEINGRFKASIHIKHPVSEAYKNQISTLIDKLLNQDSLNFVPPDINYYGIDSARRSALCDLQKYMLEHNKMPPRIEPETPVQQRSQNQKFVKSVFSKLKNILN